MAFRWYALGDLASSLKTKSVNNLEWEFSVVKAKSYSLWEGLHLPLKILKNGKWLLLIYYVSSTELWLQRAFPSWPDVRLSSHLVAGEPLQLGAAGNHSAPSDGDPGGSATDDSLGWAASYSAALPWGRDPALPAQASLPALALPSRPICSLLLILRWTILLFNILRDNFNF